MWEVFPSVLTDAASAGFLLGWSSHTEDKFSISFHSTFKHNITWPQPANRLHFSVGGDTIFKKRCLLSAPCSGAFVLVVGLCQGMTLALAAFPLHRGIAVCHRVWYLTTVGGQPFQLILSKCWIAGGQTRNQYSFSIWLPRKLCKLNLSVYKKSYVYTTRNTVGKYELLLMLLLGRILPG